MPKITLSIACLLFSFQIAGAQDFTYTTDSEELKIAFGSCNKQDKPQPLWDDISATNPDYFLFLGDNIYGDTEDMELLEQKYALQNRNEPYRKLKNNVQMIGIWDDHDYGANDAGAEYPKKEESQQLFLNFFNRAEDHPTRKREGIYSSHLINWKGQRIKLLMLDTRYHRGELKKVNRAYIKNDNGTILGNAQWKWLEEELSSDSIDLFIIGSSIQVISKDHAYEKWANFPAEKRKIT